MLTILVSRCTIFFYLILSPVYVSLFSHWISLNPSSSSLPSTRITYLYKNMYRLTTQDLCLWEPPPFGTKTTAQPRYNVIGRLRVILISRGEVLTISFFWWSTYILISVLIELFGVIMTNLYRWDLHDLRYRIFCVA